MPTPATPYSGQDFYCDVALRDIDALDVVFADPLVFAYHHTRPAWPCTWWWCRNATWTH